MYYQSEHQFTDFDAFNSAPHGWDVDFSTTSAGAYKAVLKNCAAQGLLLNTVWLSSSTLQQASAPAGSRTFALPQSLPNACCWRGHAVDTNTFMTFSSDRELFSMMGADSEITTVSVEQRLVDDCLRGWELEPDVVFRSPHVTQLSESQHKELRQNLDLLSEFILKYGDHKQFPQLSRGLQEYLIENMLWPALHNIEKSKISESTAAKRVQKAADYILTHLGEPLTVADICDHIGTSRRSLEQSFRMYTGTSPKQFIQITRLEHCRRALRKAAPGEQIRQVALNYGFWHMGQFSSDYKALFGELPSQTLSKQ